MIADGAVLVDGDRIVAVGPAAELAARAPDAERLGGPGHLVLPGLINAHQHLTGDRLVRSTIPDDIDARDAIFQWAVPIHAAHTGDDDELSATLALVEAVGNGITFTVEAGTVAHPDRVLAAFDAVGVGGTLGSWGWDVDDAPFAGSVDEVLDRQRPRARRHGADHPRVDGWVTLVGHDLMSDELVDRGQRAGPRRAAPASRSTSPPATPTPTSYLARTGRRPLVHLDALGVLGPHVLLAHAVHLDDAEVDVVLRRDVAIAYCPWAYLRLGQGVARAGRHAEIVAAGGRVALGCDSENAGDHVDVLRAATLAAGLALDAGRRRSAPTPRWSWPRSPAPRRSGMGARDRLARGRQAGRRRGGRHDRAELGDPLARPGAAARVGERRPRRPPRRGVGTVVVRDRQCTTVDLPALAAEAQIRQRRLLAEAGLDPQPKWPVA